MCLAGQRWLDPAKAETNEAGNLHSACRECADDEGAGGTLTGRVFLPKQSSAIPSTRVLLTADSGVQSSAFLLPDGAFTISGLPSGSYRLDVACMGFMFPQVCINTLPKALAPMETTTACSDAASPHCCGKL